MKTCEHCGQRKPANELTCPSCGRADSEILRLRVGGTPMLTLAILALLLFWIYRFWRIGWIAWSGNLRAAALLALGVGAAAVMFGSMWTFGVRSRKQGLLVLVIAGAAFLLLQLV